MGMSLGGYVSALMATVEPRLDFAVPMIPLSSVADFAKQRGLLNGSRTDHLYQHVMLDRVYRVVSPLHAPALVPPEGRLVLAARDDRICPISHAERLAEHFEAPLVRFAGSHLMQYGRGRGFRAVGRMLSSIGWDTRMARAA